mmetsp:Transcript_3365/g.12952  ORF Transcript_3365/g.12952 Transcript_3365/m.12952 type:complete len:281 (-) Transcript_3365:210-1052(-)
MQIVVVRAIIGQRRESVGDLSHQRRDALPRLARREAHDGDGLRGGVGVEVALRHKARTARRGQDVALVGDERDHEVVGRRDRLGPQLLDHALRRLERPVRRDVEEDEGREGVPEIHAHVVERPVAFLARRVPDLEVRDGAVLERHRSTVELDADGHVVRHLEVLLGEHEHDARLAHLGVADDDVLKKVRRRRRALLRATRGALRPRHRSRGGLETTPKNNKRLNTKRPPRSGGTEDFKQPRPGASRPVPPRPGAVLGLLLLLRARGAVGRLPLVAARHRS